MDRAKPIFAALFMSFSMLSADSLMAQESSPSVTENVAKVTFLNPGFAYEAKTGKSKTLYTQIFLNTSLRFDLEDDIYADQVTSTAYFDPALSTQYRFYYNYKKRNGAGKRTAKNSMNFFAPIYEGHLSKAPFPGTSFEEIDRRLLSTIGAVWGMQRNYAGRFSLDIYTGLGYTFGKESEVINGTLKSGTSGAPALIAQVNIGIWLGKK